VAATPQQDVNQQLEWEVNRLLKQLKYPPGQAVRPHPRTSRPSMRTHVAHAAADTAPSPAGVWARVALGGLLVFAISQWPYSRACGASLGFYLLAIATAIFVGGWAGVASWKRRMALAHVLGLCLGLWGFALTAAEIFPRVGYARAQATWMCGD